MMIMNYQMRMEVKSSHPTSSNLVSYMSHSRLQQLNCFQHLDCEDVKSNSAVAIMNSSYVESVDACSWSEYGPSERWALRDGNGQIRKRNLEHSEAKSNKTPGCSHLHFFKGLWPHSEGFSLKEKLKFQKGVLDLLTNICNKVIQVTKFKCCV
jgi:hypothetical protein